MNWNIPSVLVCILVLAGLSQTLPEHWHESGGYATKTKGGLGGKVVKVTNLNASGPGSLKEAASSGNSLVVFEVGGVIDLDGGGISIGGSNITIAGQTAPAPGITLVRGSFSVRGKDVVVSHITVQLGADVGGHPDASDIGGENVVFDHFSVFWGKDETLTIKGAGHVTLFKCIVAEGLQYTGHADVEHSKGNFITGGNRNISLIGSLCAHNALRNPRVDGGDIVIANHVVYNWAPGWDHQGPLPDPENPVIGEKWFNKVVSIRTGCNATFVGNVGLKGPESVAEYFLDGHNGTGNAYLKDNIIKDMQGNDLSVVNEEAIKVLDSPPVWPDGLEPLPASEALYHVLRTVGPRPGERNFHNSRLVRTVAEGKGEIIDSQEEVGGYAEDPQTNRPISVPDGEAARQAWLDSLEDAMAVDKTVDLSRFYGMVGSRASDMYASPSIGLAIPGADATGLKLVRTYFDRRQMHADFSLNTAERVTATLSDLTGRPVGGKRRGYFSAGKHAVAFDVRDLPVGLHVLDFKAGRAAWSEVVYRR